MPITVSRTDFVNGITWVSHALPNRPVNPIAGCIRMQVKDGGMTLEAFNYEQAAVASLSAKGADCTVAIPGRLLADLARSVTDSTIQFDIRKDSVKMTSGRAVFTLRTMPVDDFPGLPGLPPTLGTVDGGVFAAAAQQVALAASADTSLPALTSVQIVSDPKARTLTLAATDRYRLATTTIDYTPADDVEGQTFLVPAKALLGYAKTFAHANELTLHQDGAGEASLFGVSADGRTATTRLISGDFPKYQSLLPTEFVSEVSMPVAELAAAVKRVALVSDHGKPLQFTAAVGGSVTITAGGTGAVEQHAEEELDANFTGEDVATAFNPQYLLDGLTSVGADKVKMQFQAGRRPALFVAGEGDSATRYLVMPVNAS